jgi:hypothetical protein
LVKRRRTHHGGKTMELEEEAKQTNKGEYIKMGFCGM